MSLLAQSSRAVFRAPRTLQVRHSSHGHYHHLPFAWPTNKPAWAIKVGVFLVSGFAIPFVAAGIQLRKSAGPA